MQHLESPLRRSIVILGAGPAGLGTALQLARRDTFDVTVIERSDAVGGNAGSFELDGLQVDYGSHRLHPSCAPEILDDIRHMLGSDLLERRRHGRIRLRGRWLHFPLQPLNLMLNLPPSFLMHVLRDSAGQPFRKEAQDTFAGVLEQGLGRTICRDFYFPYAEKIWGVKPDRLDAEQARRRVSAGSLTKLVKKVAGAVPGLKVKQGNRFYYPRRGFGQISEAYHKAADAAGVEFKFNSSVAEIEVRDNCVISVTAIGPNGRWQIRSDHVFSTIPLPVLVRSIRPGAPDDVLAAADSLQYRAMILVYLTLSTEHFTEYDAHYFPNANVAITRLSEPKNYSGESVPGKTVLCAELPCDINDRCWSLSDEELSRLVQQDLANVGIPISVPVCRVKTRRLPQAYPIYTTKYRENFHKLDGWLSGLKGLTTLGRQGLFAHDNTHHTLAMANAASFCMSADGTFDRTRWAECRQEFESHVVED